jgi:hypothetical protein
VSTSTVSASESRSDVRVARQRGVEPRVRERQLLLHGAQRGRARQLGGAQEAVVDTLALAALDVARATITRRPRARRRGRA